MKVIIADLFSQSSIKQLEEAKWEVIYDTKFKDAKLVEALAAHNPEVLVVRSTKVSKEAINAAPNLKLIIRAGAGYDTIDFNYAATKSIKVANCPGKNSSAVAELAIGLILAIDRKLIENTTLLKAGKWQKASYASCKGVKGRTIGLIGLGFVARSVAQVSIALGMKVVAFDPSGKGAEGVDLLKSIDDVIAVSDVISLHCPSTSSTKGMINSAFLSRCKKDAYLINTARGDLVKDEELVAHLEANKDFWYAADAWNGEPSAGKADFSSPLTKHPKVIGSHHIGASTL
jgi:D-3-phosphoglycerate dehydrogenase